MWVIIVCMHIQMNYKNSGNKKYFEKLQAELLRYTLKEQSVVLC